jgi:hypothetical protein
MRSCQQLALVLLLLLLDLVVAASKLLQLEVAVAGAAVQRGSALRWLSLLTSSQSEYAALLHAQHTAQHSTAQLTLECMCFYKSSRQQLLALRCISSE